MQNSSPPPLNRILRPLDRFWFIELSPRWLAVLRLLVGGYALYYLSSRYDMWVSMAGTDGSLYDPVGVASWIGAPLPPVMFEQILILTIAANIAFLLGCGFTLSGPVFSALLLFVLCYRNSWSMIYHSHNLLVLHAVVLGCSRAGDALSVDRLVRHGYSKWRDRWKSGSIAGLASPHWRYGWPIRLLCVVTALTYFLCGVAKVSGPLGWSWARGEALRSQVAVDAIRKELLGDGAAPLAFALHEELWLFAAMGVATLVLELAAPLAVLDRRISRIWATLVLLFHWGIFAVMGIKFRYQLSGIALASFFVGGLRSARSERPEKSSPLSTNVRGFVPTDGSAALEQ